MKKIANRILASKCFTEHQEMDGQQKIFIQNVMGKVQLFHLFGVKIYRVSIMDKTL
jgi:hypothetical protein